MIACGATAPASASALENWSDAARVTTSVAMWIAWSVCLLCVLVPSSISLTAMRLACPTLIVSTALVVARDADPGSVVALAVAIVATLLVFSADVGDSFVQGSAYGDERRHLLRCPPAMALTQVLAWMFWTATVALAAVFALDHDWWLAAIVASVGVACTVLLPRRFHRFSRRWLVGVPAGVVIHDHVVLAETAMFLASNLRGVDAVTDGTIDAADLTGGCRGPVLRLTLADFDTVVLAGTRNDPGGKALHVRSMTVCPSRPGRALAELTTPPPSTNSPASS